MRDVLHAVAAPGRIVRLKVERAEIDRVVRRAVDAMERHPGEALLENVLALHVELDGAVGELNPWQERHAVAGAFTQTRAFLRSVADAHGGPFSIPRGAPSSARHARRATRAAHRPRRPPRRVPRER